MKKIKVYNTKFEPADIILTKDNSLLSKLIAKFQTQPTDINKTYFTHCGLLINERLLIEAKLKVQLTPINYYLENAKYNLLIVRPNFLSIKDKLHIVNKAMEFWHKSYGVQKIFLHFIDYFLNKIFKNNKPYARKICTNDNYPICSYVVAKAYQEYYIFNELIPEVVQPDDIADEVLEKRKYNWIEVYKR